jgi:hypothetical protein
MPKRLLDREMCIVVQARLIAKGSDAPMTGEAYKVRLFDRDFMQDEYLGESALDKNGVASIEFAIKDMNRGPLDDKWPDFFFVVYKGDKVIFQSQVMENVDIDSIEHYEKGKGEVIDLGTFLVAG